jgi:hypothetical protein
VKPRVFLSCGQRKNELQEARKIKAALTDFDVYIAADQKDTIENPRAILRELRRSDYFLLVNFRRDDDPLIKGSLYAHQELAIAHSLDMRIRVVSQCGAVDRGMVQYLMCNIPKFDSADQCVKAVLDAVTSGDDPWTADYTRTLLAGDIDPPTEPITYGLREGLMFHLPIYNRRLGSAAENCVVRLMRCKRVATTGSIACPGHRYFVIRLRPHQDVPFRTISRPMVRSASTYSSSRETVRAPVVQWLQYHQPAPAPPVIGVGIANASSVMHLYMNCELDYEPLPYLPITDGDWLLEYEVSARDFWTLTVTVAVTVSATTCTPKLHNQETR